MSIKNILSLDMDIFVWECIELYNNVFNLPCGEGGEKQWIDLERRLHLEKFLCFDDVLFNAVLSLLKDKFKDVAKEHIYFIKDHDAALTAICGQGIPVGDTINLYNLDHHHDIYYDDRQKEEVERFDFASLASWVYYLGYNKVLNKNIWLNDKYSAPLLKEEKNHLRFPFEEYWLSNYIDKLKEIDFDKIIICKSPDYFANKFWDKFDALIKEAEEIKGTSYSVDEEMYCIGNKTRHLVRLENE